MPQNRLTTRSDGPKTLLLSRDISLLGSIIGARRAAETRLRPRWRTLGLHRAILSWVSTDKYSILLYIPARKDCVRDRVWPIEIKWASSPSVLFQSPEAGLLCLLNETRAHALSLFYAALVHKPAMVCLFHGDYGPVDPAFSLGSGAPWIADASALKGARNLGEAEAIQRHFLRGESVAWCDQGYAWVGEDAVGWFYLATFLLVVLPYLIIRVLGRANVAIAKCQYRRGGRIRSP